MQEKKQKHYSYAIDALRIISILAVILIHTTTRTLEVSGFDVQRIPWTLFLNQIARFAVPLFFMISGFVLALNYPFHATYGTYLKKRLNRILIPYIFWSAIYYFFVYKHHTFVFFQRFLTGGASYQLYFIPTLILFYLLFPLIYKHYHFLAKKRMIISLGIFQIALLTYNYYLQPFYFLEPLRVGLFNFYIFFLGILASHHKDALMTIIGKWKIVLLFIVFALGGYIFFEGKTIYLHTHNYLAFYSQWRPDVLIYTVSLAALLYYFFSKNFSGHIIIQKISRLSFFVFFIHVLIIELFWSKIGKPLFQATHKHSIDNVFYDPFFFLSVAGISFFIAYIVHKIPRLAKISG